MKVMREEMALLREAQRDTAGDDGGTAGLSGEMTDTRRKRFGA